MARIYENGAELNDTTTGIEIDSTAGTGTISIASTNTRYSRYCYNIAMSTGSSPTYFIGSYRSSDVASDLYGKFDFQIVDYNYTSNQPVFFETLNLAGSRNFQLKLNGTSQQVQILNASDTVLATGPVLNTGEWYTIEFYFKYVLNASTVRVRINGVSIDGELTIGNSTSYHCTKFLAGATASPNTANMNFRFDNFIANDTSGSSENSWIGNQAILAFRPISAGDDPAVGDYRWALSTGGISSGTTSNYTYVDEITPDDATSWIRKSNSSIGNFATDWYDPEAIGTTGHITSNMNIKCVSVNGRMGGNGATDRFFTYIFQTTSGGTKQSSSSLNANANAWFMMDVNDLPCKPLHVIYPSNHHGSDIVNYQFGIEASMVDAREIRASTVWMNVSFTWSEVNRYLPLLGCGS